MKQIVQNLGSGATSLLEVPMPVPGPGEVLVRLTRSLVSSGTERMLVDFGKAGWIGKVRQQPERAQEVMRKVHTDGLMATWNAVQRKISKEIPLGNSSAGVVVALGDGVTGFKPGDRVATNGPHAEMVCVSQHLCALVPESVSDDDAAFTVMGAIALQGIRLIAPTFGESVVVYGLGLIGQLAVQLLQANGCRVIGIDPDPERCATAGSFCVQTICNTGGDRAESFVLACNGGREVDAVLITASAKDDQILADSAAMCRKRGRIVLTGVIDTHLSRNDFYKKELSFQVSSAYGPGRYEYEYERGVTDYPEAFVRWTAQRNMQAVLQAMAAQQLRPSLLGPVHRSFSEFQDIYAHLAEKELTATLFVYPAEVSASDHIRYDVRQVRPGNAVAVIGAGSFSSGIVLPALQKYRVPIEMISSEHGLSAAQCARRFHAAAATSHNRHVFENNKVDTVFIVTPHDSHAALVIEALNAGKNVFVEKPLALNREELDAIAAVYRTSGRILDVGYNRRHAPHAVHAKKLLGDALMHISITVNAGKLITGNWYADPSVSGGRLVGELCHFIDLAAFFSGCDVDSVCANALGRDKESVSVLLKMSNGSNAVINYFTNGSALYGKERIELYSSGKTLIIDNWKQMKAYGFRKMPSASLAQDKGHDAQFAAIAARIQKGGSSLIPFERLLNTSLAAIAVSESLTESCWKSVI